MSSRRLSEPRAFNGAGFVYNATGSGMTITNPVAIGGIAAFNGPNSFAFSGPNFLTAAGTINALNTRR